MFFANVIIFIVIPRQIKEIFPLFLHFVKSRDILPLNPHKIAYFYTLQYSISDFLIYEFKIKAYTSALFAGSGCGGIYWGEK